MPEPSMGQPYLNAGRARISVGDLWAANGSLAQRGVVIFEGPGIESNYIIAPNAAFSVQVQLRTDLAGMPLPLPLELTVEFRVFELLTNAPVSGPWVGGTPVVIPAPVGASPTTAGDFTTWYSIASPAITLPAGVYRVTVIGRANWVFFVHDDTELLVR
jgi:hypothetical protein